jgi:hypothetical protein
MWHHCPTKATTTKTWQAPIAYSTVSNTCLAKSALASTPSNRSHASNQTGHPPANDQQPRKIDIHADHCPISIGGMILTGFQTGISNNPASSLASPEPMMLCLLRARLEALGNHWQPRDSHPSRMFLRFWGRGVFNGSLIMNLASLGRAGEQLGVS